MSRTLLRRAAIVASATLLLTCSTSIASARPDPGPLPRGDVSAYAQHNCPLMRIGTQLTRCDNLTGAGTLAPARIPELGPHHGVQALVTAAPPAAEPVVSLLAGGLQGSVGSTVGPDGALYVTEAVAGAITRIDPRTGATTTVASGLPRRVLDLGGAMDIAFLGRTAYVLVTLVDPAVGGSSVDGIYRVDGPSDFTLVADIGRYASANPPDTEFEVPTGVLYALEPYRGGFLVTDGHHNRVYRVTLDGRVSELIAFGNTVPTGLAVRGRTVFMAEAGPVPHSPETGRIVRFRPNSETATIVATGGRLLVDVEFGRGHKLYALSQGVFGGGPAGAPALPNTGALLKVNRTGTLTVVVDGLNLPSSLEFIRNTAYVVNLAGEVWKITNLWSTPHHGSR